MVVRGSREREADLDDVLKANRSEESDEQHGPHAARIDSESVVTDVDRQHHAEQEGHRDQLRRRGVTEGRIQTDRGCTEQPEERLVDLDQPDLMPPLSKRRVVHSGSA
jgi:hypothetical protein